MVPISHHRHLLMFHLHLLLELVNASLESVRLGGLPLLVQIYLRHLLHMGCLNRSIVLGIHHVLHPHLIGNVLLELVALISILMRMLCVPLMVLGDKGWLIVVHLLLILFWSLLDLVYLVIILDRDAVIQVDIVHLCVLYVKRYLSYWYFIVLSHDSWG